MILNGKRLRTALVTGAAKRIGRAIAEDLAANGFSVAIHASRSIETAEKFAAELRQSGRQAIAVQADLKKIDETSDLIKRASEAIGPIDLLINNASVFHKDSLNAISTLRVG